MDQDASLAETSVFIFDRFRFSSISSRSEPTGTDSPGSPAPVTHSEAQTGPSTRASSRHTHTSSHGTSSSFKLKPLLTGASHSRHISGTSQRLSRSTSVPLLALETTQPEVAPRAHQKNKSTSQTAGIPSSLRAFSRSTPVFREESEPTSTFGGSPNVYKFEECGERVETDAAQTDMSRCASQKGNLSLARAREAVAPSTPKSAPATTNVSSTLAPESMMVEGKQDKQGESSCPIAAAGHSQLSPVKVATSGASQDSSADLEADQSLRSDSLSPPRSTASAETRSSDTIELVPWQIVTNDPTGLRRSEEIFRPLSRTFSTSRSGPRTSKDTVNSARQLDILARESSSRDPTLPMPQTPLKSGSDFIWARADAARRARADEPGLREAAAVQESSHVGLGISVPVPTSALQPSDVAYPDMQIASCNEEEDTSRPNVPRGSDSVVQSHKSADPSGVMQRLLLELEHGSSENHATISGVQARNASAEREPRHRRNETLSSIEIRPRTSSIRRRHQSDDLDGYSRRRDVLSGDPYQAVGLEAVRERSPMHDVELRPTVRSATGGRRVHTDEGQLARNVHLSKWKLSQTLMRVAVVPRLGYTFELYTIIYQALFFIFQAPYLWDAISPALPLVAAALFLVLDVYIVQMHVFKGMRDKLWLCFTVLLTPTMGYCAAMCSLTIVLLTRTPDRGASAAGIHFDRERNPRGNAFQEVLRDMPFSGILFLFGAISMLFSILLATGTAVAMGLKTHRGRPSTIV